MSILRKKKKRSILITFTYDGKGNIRPDIKLDKGMPADMAVKYLEQTAGSIAKGVLAKCVKAGHKEPGDEQSNFIKSLTIGDVL